MTQIPESYFLRLVAPSRYNTRNSFQATGAPRSSDAAVYYKQYPLGWLFFAREHIAKLLAVTNPILPGLEFADLAPEMVKVWDIYARDTYMDPDNAANLQAGLEMLDAELIRRIHDMASRLVTGQKRYSDYLAAPYQPTRVPVSDSSTNRSVRVADTAGSVQGSGFDVSQSNAKVPLFLLPTAKDITRYA